MRSLASHFCITTNTDGNIKLLKYPIIRLDNNNIITETRAREAFSEEAHLEHVNGLILPRLISCFDNSFCEKPEKELSRILKVQYIKGVKFVCCTKPYTNKLISLKPRQIEVLEINSNVQYDAASKLSESESIIKGIKEYYNFISSIDLQDKVGKLVLGSNCGIVAYSNIDKYPFKIDSKTKIKTLVL